MQERADLGAREGGGCPRHCRARTHDHIDARQGGAFGTKYFTHEPLAEVSRYRPRDDAFADNDAEPGRRRAVGSCIDLEPLARYPAFECEYRRIGVRPVEPARARKRKPACGESQTPRRDRPLARRARITARPPRVFIRTRKPCVRLRRVPEGW
jgi:hypothetical protein